MTKAEKKEIRDKALKEAWSNLKTGQVAYFKSHRAMYVLLCILMITTYLSYHFIDEVNYLLGELFGKKYALIISLGLVIAPVYCLFSLPIFYIQRQLDLESKAGTLSSGIYYFFQIAITLSTGFAINQGNHLLVRHVEKFLLIVLDEDAIGAISLFSIFFIALFYYILNSFLGKAKLHLEQSLY